MRILKLFGGIKKRRQKLEEQKRNAFENGLEGNDIHLQQEILKHPKAMEIFWKLYRTEIRNGYPPNFARKTAFEKLVSKLRITGMK